MKTACRHWASISGRRTRKTGSMRHSITHLLWQLFHTLLKKRMLHIWTSRPWHPCRWDKHWCQEYFCRKSMCTVLCLQSKTFGSPTIKTFYLYHNKKSNYEARSPEERNENDKLVLKLQISKKTVILTLNIYSKHTCTFNIQTLRDYGIEHFL